MIKKKWNGLKYLVECKEDSVAEVNLLSKLLQTRYEGLIIFTS